MKFLLTPFKQISAYQIFGFLLFFCCNVYASGRVALVIGNGGYQSAPLANPVNDAEDMARALRDLGFDVLVRTNVDRKSMRLHLREFGEKLKRADVGLFYFAGHGIQIKGKNYLVPVNSNVQSADEVEDESLAADAVLRKMETAGNDVNIVILDACRNNPFTRSFRNLENGLARMEGPVGSYIAYATAPGSVASDGPGRNGLYTQYLLQALRQPGLTIEQTFKFVRNGVRADTEGKQTPWESSSLTGEFIFRVDHNTTEMVNSVSPIQIPPPPVSTMGHLQVITNVANAKVSINNRNRGLVNDRGVLNISNLSENQVELVITANGYQQHRQKVALAPGQWKTLTIKLQLLTKQNDYIAPNNANNNQKLEPSFSCFKNERILLRNRMSIQKINAEKQRKSHSPELNAIITNALKKYQIKVIDARDISSEKKQPQNTLSPIDEFKRAAKKYNTDYVLAVDINISEIPITTVKTKMKTIQGDVTLRMINGQTAQTLASKTHSFTKAGIKIRPIIKKIMQQEINSSVQQLLSESCATVKIKDKNGFLQRAKNLFNF